MTTYTDSLMDGKVNVITDTAGSAIFDLGLGWDEVTGTSNETVDIRGGPYVYAGYNSFNFSGTNNVINLLGMGTDFYIRTMYTAGFQDVIGQQNDNNNIIAGVITDEASIYWNFRVIDLVYITAMYGSEYGSDITGGGQYVSGTEDPIPVYIGGEDNNTIHESGSDTTTETYGSDYYIGLSTGTGTNTYYATGNEATYTPETPSGSGQNFFNSGANWLFRDVAGFEIELINFQSVVFNDQTLYAYPTFTAGSYTFDALTVGTISTSTSGLAEPITVSQSGSTITISTPYVGYDSPASLVDDTGQSYTVDNFLQVNATLANVHTGAFS